MCLFVICILSLLNCLFKSFAHLKNWLVIFLLLRFKSSLNILDTNLLSDMWFADFFSQSVTCSIYSLIFHRAKDFNVDEVWHSFVFSFMDHAFDVLSRNSLPNSRLQIFSPMFSFGSFIFLCFIFRSMIHFELSFLRCEV